MKNYTVARIAAERILKYKEQQKTVCLFLLKEEMCKEAAVRSEFIIILCELVSLLDQFVSLVDKMLFSGGQAKIPVTQQQLSMMKVFTIAIRSLEERATKEFDLSLQIH